MKLIESTTRLLQESPESLGFPRSIGDEIRDLIKHRKAQDYVARWLKNFPLKEAGISRGKADLWTGKIFNEMNNDEVRDVARSMGLVYDLKKSLGVDKIKDDTLWSMMGKQLNRTIRGEPTVWSGEGTVSDLLEWRKKILKNTSGRTSSITNTTISIIINTILKRDVINPDEELIDVLNSGAEAWRKFKGMNLQKAQNKATRLHAQEVADPDNIVVNMPGGWYWYKIESREECDLEGKMMQHCGEVGRGSIMYSLRDKHNNPHMTVEYHKRKQTIPQVRGKQNELPPKKYWEYIPDLVSRGIKKNITMTDTGMEGTPEDKIKDFKDFINTIPEVTYISNKPIRSEEKLSQFLREVTNTTRNAKGVASSIRESDEWREPSMMVTYRFKGIPEAEDNINRINRVLSSKLEGWEKIYLFGNSGFQWQGLSEARIIDGRLNIYVEFGFGGEFEAAGVMGRDWKTDLAQDVEEVLSRGAKDEVRQIVMEALEG